MEDYLIDDSGFELGMPTPVEMLKHQCDLLCVKLETTRRDLRRAHKSIAGLIIMNRGCTKACCTKDGTRSAEVGAE